MSSLENVTIKMCVDAIFKSSSEQEKASYFNEIKERLIKNIGIYSQYIKWFAEKDEPTKDTLFWEFGKEIGMLYGEEKSLIILMMSMELSVKGLSILKPKENFIDKVI